MNPLPTVWFMNPLPTLWFMNPLPTVWFMNPLPTPWFTNPLYTYPMVHESPTYRMVHESPTYPMVYKSPTYISPSPQEGAVSISSSERLLMLLSVLCVTKCPFSICSDDSLSLPTSFPGTGKLSKLDSTPVFLKKLG